MIVKMKNNKAIINDVIEPKDFKVIKEFWQGLDVPWQYNDGVVGGDEEEDFQFVNVIWDMDFQPHPQIWQLTIPILNILRPYSLIKIKANLRTRSEKIAESAMHTDNYQAGALTAIYYINTCDGYTAFKDGDKFESVENTLLIFPSHMLHCGTTTTNTNRRILINFNYCPQPDGDIANALLTDTDKEYLKNWSER